MQNFAQIGVLLLEPITNTTKGDVMSHTITGEQIKRERIPRFLDLAEQLGMGVDREVRVVKLFGSNKEKGYRISPPGWAYPIVLTPEGEIKYDTYRTSRDAAGLLDDLLLAYAADTLIDAGLAVNVRVEETVLGSASKRTRKRLIGNLVTR